MLLFAQLRQSHVCPIAILVYFQGAEQFLFGCLQLVKRH